MGKLRIGIEMHKLGRICKQHITHAATDIKSRQRENSSSFIGSGAPVGQPKRHKTTLKCTKLHYSTNTKTLDFWREIKGSRRVAGAGFELATFGL